MDAGGLLFSSFPFLLLVESSVSKSEGAYLFVI
jgi:hypothetical protein